MTPTPKNVIASSANQSARGTEILRPVVYTYVGLIILLLAAYLSGCADFEVTKGKFSDSVQAQSDTIKYLSKAQEAKVKAIIEWAKGQNAAMQGMVLGMLLSDRSIEDMAKVVSAVHKPGPTAGEIWAQGLTRSLVPLASIGFGTWLGITSINGMRDVAAGAAAGSVTNNYNRSNNSSTGAQNIDTGNTYNLNQPDPTTSTATGTTTFDFRTVTEPAR